MSYIDRLRDGFQRMDGKKSPVNQVNLDPSRHRYTNTNRDNDSQFRNLNPSGDDFKVERNSIKQETGLKMIRHSASAVALNGNRCYTPRFEVYDTYALVAKQYPSSGSTLAKSRSDQHIRPHHPVVTFRPHYGQNLSKKLISESNAKLIRTSNLNDEKNRPHTSQIGLKPQRNSSTIIKTHNSGNLSNIQSYDSLNRTKVKAPSKAHIQNYDKPMVYNSLPRPKSQSQNGIIYYGSTKRIPSDPLYIDVGSKRKDKEDKLKVRKRSIEATVPDGIDENFINFSSTLAKAATNSPPIRRRSSLLNFPNPGLNSRFATKSTIDEIYTQKNRKDNYEKYKKVANEILRENLALKFGENFPVSNLTKDNFLHSSTSSLSSASSGTDQQHSISSIPPDEISLDIPNQNKTPEESFHSNQLFHPHKTTEMITSDVEIDDNTEIVEGTVTSGVNHLEIVNNVHISDEDSEEGDDKSNSESCTSDVNVNIEDVKNTFLSLNEIECMEDEFPELPDHQHSHSFRIENTSVGTMVDVFVHKDSLQRAKNALMTVPNHGILSNKLKDFHLKKNRRALFDPHILLLDACLEPDYTLVKELVPKISDISRSTVDGITALHNAVCSAEARLVLFLIQSGANVNASDADGWTPLHCAACCNNKQISKILVENGASLFAVTLSDFEIPSQKCNKTNQEDTQCEEFLIWEQDNIGVANAGIVYSLFEYAPLCSDELSLSPNQILKVTDTKPANETGWFIAEDISEMVNTPKRGLVAAAYVSCYPLTILKH